MSDIVFWVCMLIVGGLTLLVLVWIAIDTVIQKRKKKHVQKTVEERQQKQAAQDQEFETEPEEPLYVSHVGISKQVDEHLRLIQVITKAGSPGEVMSDALRFYAEIVHMYSPGDQLLLNKSSGQGAIHLRFKPLDRIEKKIES